MKLQLAIWLANLAGWLSRFLKRGSGVMVTGRIILKLAPKAAAELSRNRKIILVSGTNGKTTTTALIQSALSTKFNVACNATGANLRAGVAEALSKNRKAPIAVLEVDEMVIPWAINQTHPTLVVLLNLGRDQLDRLSEVRSVAQKWKVAIQNLPSTGVVFADADDPFIVWAAQDASRTIWFSSGGAGHLDASTCPVCGEVLVWSSQGTTFSCVCGFSKPTPDWILQGKELSQTNGKSVIIESAIPGLAALTNTARAVIVADAFHIPIELAIRAVSRVSSVEGRFGTLKIGATTYRLLLSKNPASWRETLTTSASGPRDVLLVVNANTQDGKDTSWLWDVDFSPLSGRNVVVTGERRTDVAARLTVNGINHRIVGDEAAASKIFGARDVDIIASYTAFHRLAKLVKTVK